MKTLWGWAAAGNYFTFRDSSTSAAYQVPANKTFYITNIKLGVENAGSRVWVAIGHSTADAGMNGSAPTGYADMIGDGSAACRSPFSYVDNVNQDRGYDVLMPVATGKYISARVSNSQVAVLIQGYEV